MIKHQIFPCVFALLPNKTEATYNPFLTEVLNAVRNIGNEPEDILVDFETAAMNAITNQLNQLEVNISNLLLVWYLSIHGVFIEVNILFQIYFSLVFERPCYICFLG